MAKLVFAMNQSLDGYVDHMAFASGPTLFRLFIGETQGQAGSVYSRQRYEVMRYWDDDHPEWDAEERRLRGGVAEPAEMGRLAVVELGRPNATVVEGDYLERAIRELKAERDGEIEVAGRGLGAKPHQTWPDRRVSNLTAPPRAWSRQAIFRRAPAAAPPYD